MYRALTTAWELSSFCKIFVAKILTCCGAWVKRGELGVREAPHTQFPLTRCLIKLTYLCNGHPRRGPVLSHSPLEGVETLWWTARQCAMVKEPLQHCDGGEKWILSVCHEWQRYWDHDVRRWGVTDICCDSSDICILGWVAIRSNRYLPWWQWYLYS